MSCPASCVRKLKLRLETETETEATKSHIDFPWKMRAFRVCYVPMGLAGRIRAMLLFLHLNSQSMSLFTLWEEKVIPDCELPQWETATLFPLPSLSLGEQLMKPLRVMLECIWGHRFQDCSWVTFYITSNRKLMEKNGYWNQFIGYKVSAHLRGERLST